jgi:hypothetical protein
MNFQDLYGLPPKVYLVTDKVIELQLYRPVGDRQNKQAYYESPNILRVKPPTEGTIVVYTGEMGLYGCDSITYKKDKEKPVEQLSGVLESLTVPPNTIMRGPVQINGPVIIQEGGELWGATIKKNQPYGVRMLNNTTLADSIVENFQDESSCVQTYGTVKLIGNKFEGVRACAVMSETRRMSNPQKLV